MVKTIFCALILFALLPVAYAQQEQQEQQEQGLQEAIHATRDSYPYDPLIKNLVKLHKHYKTSGQEKRIYPVIDELIKPPKNPPCGQFIVSHWQSQNSIVEELIKKSPDLALIYLDRISETGRRIDKYLYRRALKMRITQLQKAGRTNEVAADQQR